MSEVVRIKGTEVEMGGETFVVPPLNLASLEQLEDRLAAFTGDVFKAEQRAIAIDATLAALRRNYPDMTRERLAELLDVGNMARVVAAVMGVSAIPEGRADASGNVPAG